MLRSLHMKDVGPAPQLDLELAPRRNVLTGDNGLGKSFVLDVAWWALTGTWLRRPVLPRPGQGEECGRRPRSRPRSKRSRRSGASISRMAQQWSERFPPIQSMTDDPGVSIPAYLPQHVPVLYVRADGGFSVWDPARNHSSVDSRSGLSVTIPDAYHFNPAERSGMR